MKTATTVLLLLCSHALLASSGAVVQADTTEEAEPEVVDAGTHVEGQCVGDESVCGAAPLTISMDDNGWVEVPTELVELIHKMEANRIGVDETLEQRVEELDQQMQRVEKLNETLSVRKLDLRQMVAEANVQQLHVLQDRLTEWGSVEEAIQEKMKLQQQIIQEKQTERKNELADLQQLQQQNLVGVLTKQEWSEMRFADSHVETMIKSAQDKWTAWSQNLQDEQMDFHKGAWQAEFEQALEKHTVGILDTTQELARMQFKEEREKIEQLEQASAEAAVKATKELAAEKVPNCLTKNEAADTISDVVNSHLTVAGGLNLINFATPATAQIVYTNDMTTRTFMSPHNSDMDEEEDEGEHPWWHPRSILNSRQLYNLLHAVGLQAGSSRPPEQILSASSVVDGTIFMDPPALGSCWPMEGSFGEVTIRFTTPIHVRSIVIDQAAPPLHGLDVAAASQSAVRYFEVLGYGPCDVEGLHDSCALLGFDSSQPRALGEFEYNHLYKHVNPKEDAVLPPLWQSFTLADSKHPAHKVEHHARHGQEEALEEEEPAEYITTDQEEASFGTASSDEEEEEGCSTTTTQCSTPPSAFLASQGMGGEQPSATPVPKQKETNIQQSKSNVSPNAIQAITIKVEDNWGHDDYTCLYGIRVIGTPAALA